MKSVWIVDEDRSVRWVLKKALEGENISCRSFGSADEAFAALKRGEKPRVMISDLRMESTSTFDLLTLIKNRFPELVVIIITAHSALMSSITAFKMGAFDYLSKPFEIEQAVELVRRALEEIRHQGSTISTGNTAPKILSQAPSMQVVLRAIDRLTPSNATVFISGESGTGKLLVARALHCNSLRKAAPFISFNAAATPRDLIESELFGHENRTFTGTNGLCLGRFEQAENGTLYLEEIGDMPADVQMRLLRALSDGYFYRVDGQLPIKANVRIIAATRENIEDRVRQGLFRIDLFHRINVIRLRLPPIRERREDITLLTRHFLAKSAREFGVEAKRLTKDMENYLNRCFFPGNVRQLENLCQSLTVMTPGSQIDVADLPAGLHDELQGPITSAWLNALADATDGLIAAHPGEVFDRLVCDFERMLIQRALSATGGRRNDAAQLLGISRNTLSRKMALRRLTTVKRDD